MERGIHTHTYGHTDTLALCQLGNNSFLISIRSLSHFSPSFSTLNLSAVFPPLPKKKIPSPPSPSCFTLSSSAVIKFSTPMATPSRTHLCNLIQQFVVFLPFLQGAQIAAHSSCQGNGAECPPECVRRLRCVCELPPGAKHTRAPLPWLPPLLSLIRVSSEIPPPFHLLQAQETHSHTQTHTCMSSLL